MARGGGAAGVGAGPAPFSEAGVHLRGMDVGSILIPNAGIGRAPTRASDIALEAGVRYGSALAGGAAGELAALPPHLREVARCHPAMPHCSRQRSVLRTSHR